MKNQISLKSAAAIAAVLILGSCADAPKTNDATAAAKEAVKPPEPGPAKQAFWKMYKPIREWSKDAIVLSVTSKEIPELKGDAGKEAVWIAVFVSPLKREAREVTYSEVDSGKDIHKGVTVAAGQVWSGATRDSQPFQNSDFGVDSDAAFKTAATKADAWLKTHPKEKVNLLLGKAARYATPVWVVTWGDSKSGYVAVVNAVNGEMVSPK